MTFEERCKKMHVTNKEKPVFAEFKKWAEEDYNDDVKDTPLIFLHDIWCAFRDGYEAALRKIRKAVGDD